MFKGIFEEMVEKMSALFAIDSAVTIFAHCERHFL